MLPGFYEPPQPDNLLAFVAKKQVEFVKDEIPEDIMDVMPAITWDIFSGDEQTSYQGLLGGNYIVTVYTHAPTKAQARTLAMKFYADLYSTYSTTPRFIDQDGVYLEYLRCSNLPTETKTPGQQANYYRYSATYRVIVRAQRG